MSFDWMKNKYNNKYGMNERMDMDKFEKMYDMVKSMKHQSSDYSMQADHQAPIAAFRSAMNFDNNNQKSMDFNKMANFFKNFRSKRQAAGDALALNDRLKEKIQHVFEEQQSKIGNMSCCKNAKQKLCMNQDIKNKIESNFGPVDEILESFNYQITEDQLFTQVNQLLQGSEDEYM